VKTRLLMLPLFLALLASTTTEPGIPMRATSAQTEICKTTPQHVRSNAWKP
jgi:hypothetical protein